MTYFSMKIVRNYGARFFTRSIDTQVFFDTHPAYRWNKDGSKFQGKLIWEFKYNAKITLICNLSQPM